MGTEFKEGEHRSVDTEYKVGQPNIYFPLGSSRPDMAKENHWNWQNGISFEPYTIEFNRQLKELIRSRDNFTCQDCGVTEKEMDRRLCIHHIDYNKENCLLDNLITLCRSCNAKVNFNRKQWTEYFQEKIMYKKGGDD